MLSIYVEGKSKDEIEALVQRLEENLDFRVNEFDILRQPGKIWLAKVSLEFSRDFEFPNEDISIEDEFLNTQVERNDNDDEIPF